MKVIENKMLLTRNATPAELIQAAALNHISWFSENAIVANGEVENQDGLTVVYSPASDPSALGEVILAFPQMNEGDSVGAALDVALKTFHHKKVRQVSCWSVVPTQPSDLAARLA